jgi:hypothetical protein
MLIQVTLMFNQIIMGGLISHLVIGSIGMSVALLTLVWVFANADVAENGNLMLGESGTLALVAANAYMFSLTCRGAQLCGYCWVKCSQIKSVVRDWPLQDLRSG